MIFLTFGTLLHKLKHPLHTNADLENRICEVKVCSLTYRIFYELTFQTLIRDSLEWLRSIVSEDFHSRKLASRAKILFENVI